MYKHNTLTSCNINVFDGCKLNQTMYRGSMYKHNPACISAKRKKQVIGRMYRCYWT